LSTVGVLGDLCRNVEDGILPCCDEIMSILITNLGREDVHRTIKPQVGVGVGGGGRACVCVFGGMGHGSCLNCLFASKASEPITFLTPSNRRTVAPRSALVLFSES